ncbi:MAG: RNA polymerase sigma factor [Bacteroidota bacterium]
MTFFAGLEKDNATTPARDIQLEPAGDMHYVYGIRSGKKDVLNNIYTDFFPLVKRMVLKNSGNQEDARDIFQEAIIVIYKKFRQPDFILTSRFDTYLYAVARNLWFMNLRRRNVPHQELEDVHVDTAVEHAEETLAQASRDRLYLRVFAELGEQCRKLLQMYMQGISMKNIAESFGFASEAYAKKRKFKCKEQLIERIKKDEAYKTIVNRG